MDGPSRPDDVVRIGAAFASNHGDHWNDWVYNDRSELQDSQRYLGTSGTGSPVDEEFFNYAYDNAGNRDEFTVDVSPDEVTTEYAANALNQYTWTNYEGPCAPAVQNVVYDADGNLATTYIAGDMNCDGTIDSEDIDPFYLAMGNPTQYLLDFPDCNILNGDINGDGAVDSEDGDLFWALLGGGNSGIWRTYSWDAENRLVGVAPGGDPQDGAKRASFTYDYMGRRVRKQVETWHDGQQEWDLTLDRKFIYDGWLLLLEVDGLDSDAVILKYTWGLDLSGQSGGDQSRDREGAGGIGGLLAMQDSDAGEDYLFFYDNLGNVGQLVAWESGYGGATDDEWHADRLVAHYEYAPYGGVLYSSGTFAGTNTMRFSTKYFDAETGLGYWGYRYYSPTLGRWVSRDPVWEDDDPNLMRYAFNSPANSCDPFGLRRKRCPVGQVPCSNGLTPPVNGCGAKWSRYVVPNHPRPGADFNDACNEHDLCYADCKKYKSECDREFYDSMQVACFLKYGWMSITPMPLELRIKYKACLKAARIYYVAVRDHGESAHTDAQEEYCTCCSCPATQPATRPATQPTTAPCVGTSTPLKTPPPPRRGIPYRPPWNPFDRWYWT